MATKKAKKKSKKTAKKSSKKPKTTTSVQLEALQKALEIGDYNNPNSDGVKFELDPNLKISSLDEPTKKKPWWKFW